FFGDQAKLRCVFLVVLIVKRHWLEGQDCFAGFFHGLYLRFESARRTKRTELSVGIDQDRYGVGVLSLNAANTFDKTGIADVFTDTTNANGVAGGNNISPGIVAQGDIAVAGRAVCERRTTDGCVTGAGAVTGKRRITVGCVVVGGGVAKESVSTRGGVVLATGVIGEGDPSVSRVADAAAVA